MKRSAKVTVAFLSSFAAAVMNSCGDDGDWVEAKRCVDSNNVVAEDRMCEQPPQSSTGTHGRVYHSYYYGGRGYYPGDVVSGGGHAPQSGVNYRSTSSMPRGGFGSTGKAFVSRGGSISS